MTSHCFQPSFVRLLEEWDRRCLFESSTEKYAPLALVTGSGGSGSGGSSSSNQSYVPTSLISSSYSTLPKQTAVRQRTHSYAAI